jgi:hypothetical protein
LPLNIFAHGATIIWVTHAAALARAPGRLYHQHNLDCGAKKKREAWKRKRRQDARFSSGRISE